LNYGIFSITRIYDIARPDQPMMRFALFDNVSHSSKRSFSNVLGDTAIDFDIAPPITDSSGNHVFHVYVMQESGDVWVLQCKFSQNR